MYNWNEDAFSRNEKKYFSIGINTAKFNSIYAHQQKPNWCWAACIEMILKHYGINVSQREFAKRTCGVDWQGYPADCATNDFVITKHLRDCYYDDEVKYCLNASLEYGDPHLHELYKELKSNNPVIVAHTNPFSDIGHVVLITGIEGYFLNSRIYVSKFIIRDPADTEENRLNNGRVVKHSARNFMNTITSHWFVNLSVDRINRYNPRELYFPNYSENNRGFYNGGLI